VAKTTADGAGDWVAKSGAFLADGINQFAFLYTKTLIDSVGTTLLKRYKSELEIISADLLHGDTLLSIMNFLNYEEKALLAAYLGTDPYPSKKRTEKVLSDLERKERQRELQKAMRMYGGKMW
jgi:hypothetical protein